MKKYIVNILMAAMLISGGLSANAQNFSDTSGYVSELSWIKAIYYKANHLQFGVTCYVEEADSMGIRNDTLRGGYKVHGDNYWSEIDSVIQMQNSEFKIKTFLIDSLMEVETPSPFEDNLFQFNLADPQFQQSYLHNVTVTDVGAQKKMKFIFRSDAPFISYEMYYDTATRYVKEIKFAMKKSLFTTPPEGSGTPLPASYISLRMLFSGHAEASFADEIFSTNLYFTKAGGKYNPVAPYTGFAVIKNNSEE